MFLGTPDEHIEDVRQILTLLHDMDVTLNLKNCQFSTKGIDYLGHVIF